MSATREPSTNGTTTTEDLADELHQLEVEEASLAERTRRLEFSNPLTLLFSILAFALALGALIVALTHENGNSASSGGSAQAASASTAQSGSGTTGTPMGAMTSNGMMMGVGGHGSFTKAQVAAANSGKVYVQLGDFWVAPTVSSIRAGKVTFVAKNVGMAIHELMIERAPIMLTGPGKPMESAAQGMINDMQTGQSGQITMNLRPGTYVLFCNVTGHYAAGQHLQFTVANN
jgi:uncharacterized cupredoxin-like copper-binding protein